MSFHLEIVNLLRCQGSAAGAGCPAGDDELVAESATHGTGSSTRGAEEGWRAPSGLATTQRVPDEPAATGAAP